MTETLFSILESPSQKPILKPSSFDLDSSPFHFKTGGNQQNSNQTSFLDSTQHASFLPPPSDPPSSKVRFNRASTISAQNPFQRTRQRATSTTVKINRSVLGPSSLLDDSMNLPQTQLNISFQNNENDRRDSIDKSLLDIPVLTSFISTPAPPTRTRSRTVASPQARRSIDKQNKRKSIVASLNKEHGFGERIKLQPINNSGSTNLKESKRSSSKRHSTQNSILRLVCGSPDPLKKDRFVRFFDNSVKKTFKATEPPKKQKEKEVKGFKGLEKITKELRSKKSTDKMDKELRSESLDEVKELSRDDREDKRKELVEYTFYKEINEMIHFCARENSVYVFLKALKLLGVMYLHFEKLDEAFFCFCQLRWASEYLGMYKAKTSAFFKMAECCKLVENYDEAIKLLRKSLQYSWEYNLVNREMKIYDTMGKLYYLKGDIKKAQYYNERFAAGISEPKDSPLRDIYNQFLIDNREKGRYGHFDSLDSTFMMRISFPLLPTDLQRRSSILSSLSSLSIDDQKRKEIEERPKNVKRFQEQLSVVVTDSELVLQRNSAMDGDEADDKQEGPEMVELPSPSFKTNLAELDAGKSNEQKLTDLRLKEERLNNIIRNARKELEDGTSEGDRKKSMHNIFELQIAFQREKRLILGQQQDYRIHLAKLWKSQYHVFENKKKPGICRANLKTESNIVMENKYDMTLEEPDFFQTVKKKIMALRFENNLPPFVLMTHKKMPPKPLKRDKTLLNEGAKKMYLAFYKKIMKKIDPGRASKFSREDS